MNKAKYEELFAAFGKAPMKEFLELLFEGVPPALKKRLIIEDVSYHRHGWSWTTPNQIDGSGCAWNRIPHVTR